MSQLEKLLSPLPLPPDSQSLPGDSDFHEGRVRTVGVTVLPLLDSGQNISQHIIKTMNTEGFIFLRGNDFT